MRRLSEIIERGPVTLRRWREGDAAEVYPVIVEALDHLRPWMPWATGHSLERTEAYVANADLAWVVGDGCDYAIRTEGRIIGSCGLMTRIGPGGLELGYWLHPAFTGRGLMTVAGGALVDEAATVPGVDHVEIHHDAANLASAAVARRLGFTEVERRERAAASMAPADCGVEVVWRRATR
jgi:RimJ/RimL family protein N-acetyltransferase